MSTALILLGLFAVLCLLRVPIAYALLLACLPFFFVNDRLSAELMVQQLYGGVDSFVLLAVPLFILAAVIMNEAKVTDRLIALAHALTGWIRGGLGMVNVSASMAFGGVSGSATADVGGLGSVLIPQMTRRGYPRGYAVGITAASSVIGTIIPPSIQMVVWGALTNTSIAALFLGGVVPGVLIGLGLMAVAYIQTRRYGLTKEARFQLSEAVRACRGAILPLGVIVIVLGGIVGGVVTATEAAVLAVLYALALGMVAYRTVTVKDLPRILRKSGLLAIAALFALAAANVLAYLLALYRFPFAFRDIVDGVPAWVLLPLIAAIFILLGTFLDALAAMTIMVPVLAPAVMAAGLDPVQYGVIVAMSLAFGLITPPYGICLLLAAKIGRTPLPEAIKAVWPFGLVILATTILCIAVPELVLFLPELGGHG